MNILVCPNTLIVGGASLVAVDLAAAMRERGHRVLVLGPRGALVDRLEALGLEWLESPAIDDGSDPEMGRNRVLWPSRAMIRQIRHIVTTEGIDVIHTYEWARCLEAGFGAHLVDGVPLVSSILAVRAPKFLPRTAHIVVGTQDLANLVRSRGFPAVTLIEPRLDRLPTSGSIDAAAFASRHDLDDSVPTLVVASRLAGFKMDGLRLAIEAVEVVEDVLPVQLVIAGEGSGEGELRELAAGVNTRLGRRAVIFTGVLVDVDPAYASSDLVLGMGTALLGGMAHGKPAIVLGEQGFSALLTDETATSLSDVGFWGEGPLDGARARLARHIADALRDPRQTAKLAACSLSIIQRRPTKEQTDAKIEQVYLHAIATASSPQRRLLHASRSLLRFAGMRARGRLARRERAPEDQRTS